ncbi:Glycoside hydrolase superfamily [Penicillium canariense]|uniref:Glycoside hydrolase superfamily n=1 Tax=Penicillium canariense TaxID=189055 RepID=A0A9W9I534_9EURO|nr:Glycoside hydrolase superfamily [Penicillium canariense]KAJ5168045.1 Glycoside hydrolase superfamily [Penicillium canariense]
MNTSPVRSEDSEVAPALRVRTNPTQGFDGVMKRLNQALLVFFSHAACPDHCLAALNGASQAQSEAEVVVWVNEDGDLISTETTRVAATAAPQETVPATISRPSIPAPEPDTTHSVRAAPPTAPKDETTLADRPVPTDKMHKMPRPPAQHPHPNHPEHQHRQFGISYSPYNADRSCKSEEEVNKELDKLSEYSYVRIYGTDCNQTTTVARAARQHHMQVFAGIYDLTDFPASLKAFTDAATLPDGKKDWTVFHTVAIGNELVNGGMAAPADVSNAVNQARIILRKQGYKGPVVTVDTFSVLLKHPELCIASDYCAANCHAFFDATQQPHNAGPYALEQAHAVSDAAGGKRTIITESGWPHAGQSNGAAVPSPENQRVAVESIRRSFAHRGDDLVLFTAFDDLWKQDNQYTFDAERFWGIYQR